LDIRVTDVFHYVALRARPSIVCAIGAGEWVEGHAERLPDTKSSTPGANSVETKAAIRWLPVAACLPTSARTRERLIGNRTCPCPDNCVAAVDSLLKKKPRLASNRLGG